MIPVAMGVLKPIGISINPMIASLAMVLSSITVIINTLRLKKQVWTVTDYFERYIHNPDYPFSRFVLSWT